MIKYSSDLDQPDLNYRSQAVRDEMRKVLEFWLNFGVDGFHIDSAYHLIEDLSFQNEELSGLTDDENDPKFTIKSFSQDNTETFTLLKEWREIIQAKGILMVETSENVKNFVKYSQVSDIPIHRFFLNQFNAKWNAQEYKSKVDELLSSTRNVEDFGAFGISVS